MVTGTGAFKPPRPAALPRPAPAAFELLPDDVAFASPPEQAVVATASATAINE
jgi:hypothetical protein